MKGKSNLETWTTTFGGQSKRTEREKDMRTRRDTGIVTVILVKIKEDGTEIKIRREIRSTKVVTKTDIKTRREGKTEINLHVNVRGKTIFE